MCVRVCVCVCWQLYPISPLPDDLHHDLTQTESLTAQDYGRIPALMALLQELSLYYTRKHQTERLHAHKHTLTHTTHLQIPQIISSNLVFLQRWDELCCRQKSCSSPEIISYKTVYHIQSFLVVSCWFKPVALLVTCCSVKTFIFTVFHPQ